MQNKMGIRWRSFVYDFRSSLDLTQLYFLGHTSSRYEYLLRVDSQHIFTSGKLPASVKMSRNPCTASLNSAALQFAMITFSIISGHPKHHCQSPTAAIACSYTCMVLSSNRTHSTTSNASGCSSRNSVTVPTAIFAASLTG